MNYELEPDHAHETDRFRPTILMERISVKLELHPEPASSNWVVENVDGKASALRTALEVLVDEGYVRRDAGPRNTSLHASIRPYRQHDDHPAATASPPRPDRVPDLRSSVTASASPPLRGTQSHTDQDPVRGPTASHTLSDYPFAPIPLELEPDPDELDPGEPDPLDWTSP